MAIGALTIAWLDPKMGSELQEIESEGVDMMVALDVSNSMTEDVAGVGLTWPKNRRTPTHPHRRPRAPVVFAGDAYVQCP